jgi:sensor histidine kinase YesM
MLYSVRMKIRSKITFLMGIVFLGAVMIAALSLWTMNEMTKLDETIQSGYRLLGTAQKVHGLMKDLMFDLFTPQTYLLLKDVLHTTRFQTTRNGFRQSVRDFETSVALFMSSPRVKGMLRDQEARDAYHVAQIMTQKASQRIDSFQQAIDRLFAEGEPTGADVYMRLQTDTRAGMPLFFDEVRETSYYLTYSFESFLSYFIRTLEQESLVIRRQILLLFWLLTTAIGAATFTLSLAFARRISRRIKSVEQGVRAISQGDFTARLAIPTSDEFGALALNFNLFMKDLKRNVDSIQSLMRDIGESITARPRFQRILELIVEAAVKDSSASGAAIITMDTAGAFAVACTAGEFPLRAGAGIPYEPAENGAPVIRIHEIIGGREPVFIREERTIGSGGRVGSFLGLPLSISQGTLGLLCVITGARNAPLTDLDCTTFSTFAEYAALIIDNFFKYREILERREAEYRALQAQIQPHFVYNVLNGLIGLNRMGDSRRLESAIFSLKDMLRYILDQGRWTTVGEELRFLGRYCELQKMRFPERLAVSIRCDEKVADVRIPKLILQPIVENAVIHGIEPLDRAGHLEITAEQVGGTGAASARICVVDDGVGYETSATHAEERIGLTNARERLHISHPDARLSIESAPGAGTRIRIEIPDGRLNGEDPHRG